MIKALSALFVRLIASIAVALGGAAVARKYTEAPEDPALAQKYAEVSAAAAAEAMASEAPAQQPAVTRTIGELQHDQNAALLPGWSRPRPEKIPQPTYWPMILALGIALTMWGVISTVYVWAFGLVFLLAGIAGWVWDLIKESE